MLAMRPACALARFSFVMSTHAKAQHNIKRSGPILRRDLVPFYTAIDTNGVMVDFVMWHILFSAENCGA